MSLDPEVLERLRLSMDPGASMTEKRTIVWIDDLRALLDAYDAQAKVIEQADAQAAHWQRECNDECNKHEATAKQLDEALREELARLREQVREAAFNCPSCGRHDFGLFASEGAECRAKHDGHREQLDAERANADRLADALQGVLDFAEPPPDGTRQREEYDDERREGRAALAAHAELRKEGA